MISTLGSAGGRSDSSPKKQSKSVLERAWFLIKSLIFLTLIIALGTSIYLGFLAIYPIALALSLPGPLGLIIGAGILIASLAALVILIQFCRKEGFRRLFSNHFNSFEAIVALTAVILGIVLGPVLPLVMATAVSSFGLPSGIAMLFGAVTLAAIIAVTYELLRLPLTIRDAIKYYEDFNYYEHFFQKKIFALLSFSGIGLGALAAYFFFLPLTQVLAPVLSPGLATFLALAVSVSLAVAVMRFLTQAPDRIGLREHRRHYLNEGTISYSKGTISYSSSDLNSPGVEDDCQRHWVYNDDAPPI